jgi:hypothetical protein
MPQAITTTKHNKIEGEGIIDGETLLHDRRVWMAGALFVYFFSISGGISGTRPCSSPGLVM